MLENKYVQLSSWVEPWMRTQFDQTCVSLVSLEDLGLGEEL